MGSISVESPAVIFEITQQVSFLITLYFELRRLKMFGKAFGWFKTT